MDFDCTTHGSGAKAANLLALKAAIQAAHAEHSAAVTAAALDYSMTNDYLGLIEDAASYAAATNQSATVAADFVQESLVEAAHLLGLVA